MKLKELSLLFKDAFTCGADKAITGVMDLPDTLSKSQAYKLYGRANVDRWIAESLIHPVKSQGGTKKFIDRLKLEAVARASNRSTYLPVAERGA